MTYRERKQALKTFVSWVLWLSFKIIILYIIKNTCSYAGWTKTCMFQSPLSHNQSHPGKERGMFPLRPFSLSSCDFVALSPSQWPLFFISCSCLFLAQESSVCRDMSICPYSIFSPLPCKMDLLLICKTQPDFVCLLNCSICCLQRSEWFSFLTSLGH